MFDDAVYCVVQIQPLGRRLRADFGYAGNVVGCIANERKIIDDLLREDIKLGFDAVAIQPRFVHRIDERNVVVDELCEILVAG